MNRYINLFIGCFLAHVCFSQSTLSLKKKYLGDYFGQMSSYVVPSDSGAAVIPGIDMKVTISADNILLWVGEILYEGRGNMLYENPEQIVMEFICSERYVRDKLTLEKDSKRLIWKGMNPQPTTTLTKVK
jgi:hypothetical protein